MPCPLTLGNNRAHCKLAEPDYRAIDERYTRLGPTPRISVLYQLLPNQLREYQRDLIRSIQNLDPAKFELAVSSAEELDMTAVGHKLFLIRRKGSTLPGDPEVSPISDHVSSLLSARARRFARQEQVRLIKLFSNIPGARGMVGNLFEPYGQAIFKKEIFY